MEKNGTVNIILCIFNITNQIQFFVKKRKDVSIPTHNKI